MNALRATCYALMTLILLAAGCGTPKPAPNPLEGWKFCFSDNPVRSNKSILDDYQDYVQHLPPEEKKFIGSIQLFEDGTGQHAARIEVDLHGTRWAHVLIYDKENQRKSVIKYTVGKYSS
jgi:hypothetical protein